MDSRASSPGIVRNQVLLDFKDIKRATDPPTNREKENAENARKELLEKYKTASFGELCQMTLDSRPKETLYQCLTDIYSKVRTIVLTDVHRSHTYAIKTQRKARNVPSCGLWVP